MKVTIQFDDLAKPIREKGPKRRGEVVDILKGKTSKQEANYRPRDSDTKATCMDCEFYDFPGQAASTCRKVAGEVEARDVCDLFNPQQSGQG